MAAAEWRSRMDMAGGSVPWLWPVATAQRERACRGQDRRPGGPIIGGRRWLLATGGGGDRWAVNYWGMVMATAYERWVTHPGAGTSCRLLARGCFVVLVRRWRSA
jgi:hypothetical protein